MGKYAIFIVSALIFSLLTYSSALRNALFMSSTRTVESYGVNQAYNIAQGAAMIVVKDLYDNNDDSSFYPEEDETYSYPSSTGFQNWSEMNGSYNIYLSNQGDSLLVLQSTGRFDETDYRVRIGLVQSSGGSFTWPPVNTAVHADETIELKGGAVIQGNASINGTSVNAVRMSGGTNITGQLFIGPDGIEEDVVDLKNNNDGADGGVFNLPEEQEYEMPNFPELPILPAGNSFKTEKWNDETDYYADQFTGYYIPEISVNANYSMNIHVGDQDRKIYVGNLDLKNGHVNFVGSGKVELYVYNDINFGSGSSLNCNAQWSASNCSGDTSQLMTYYGGSNEFRLAGDQYFNGNIFIEKADVTLTAGSKLKGNLISGGNELDVAGGSQSVSAFYAPNADVKFSGGGNLSGFVISKTFTATGGTWVYEDELSTELPDLSGGGGEAEFTVSYWN